MSIKPFQLFILLAHMLKTPSIAATACEHLREVYFQHPDVGGTYFHAFLFNIIANHYLKFKVPPDRATIEAEIQLMMRNYWSGPEDPHVIDTLTYQGALFSFIENVGPTTVVVASKTIEDITHICVYAAQVKELFKEAQSGQGLNEMPEKLTQLRNSQKILSGGGAKNGLFSNCFVGAITRVQTGVDFIDRRLGQGAGPYAYCGMGILAAQGAGKTTFSIQLCASQLLLGKPALMVVTESGWDASLQAKMFACLTGIPVSQIAKYNGNILEAAKNTQGANLELVYEKLKLFDKFFYMLDLVADSTGMEGIKTSIDRIAANHGVPPAVTVIDWAGPLANSLMSKYSKQFERKEAALKHIGAQTAEIGDRLKTLCVVTHQMAPAQIAKGPTADSDHYVGQDSRAFTESFRYVITINKSDLKSGVQKLMIPKAREDTPNQVALIRLNHETSSFSEATGWRQLGRHFCQSTYNPTANGLPSETPKRNSTAVE